MAIKYSDDYLIYDDAQTDERVVISTSPVLLSTLIFGDSPLRVEADTIVVDKNMDASGKRIRLVSRILKFGETERISLGSSGASGQPSFTPGLRPISSQGPGETGLTGSDGGAGSSGGVIVVHAGEVQGLGRVHAVGGAGGRGQDGGNGMPGGGGQAGAVVNWENSPKPPLAAYSGGRGGQGGGAGLPGSNGAGGSAGQIAVSVALSLPETFLIETGTGKSGEDAKGGEAGRGGAGGGPGRLMRWNEPMVRGVLSVNFLATATTESAYPRVPISPSALINAQTARLLGRNPFVSGHETPVGELAGPQGVLIESGAYPYGPGGFIGKWVKEADGEPGPWGIDGSARHEEIKSRQLFKAQTVASVPHTLVTIGDIGAVFSETFIEMVVLALEDEYRQDSFDAKSDFWSRVAFYMEATCNSAKSSHGDVFSRLCSLARKNELGLDYYGHRLDHAPLVSMDSYRQLLDNTLLPQVRFIEERFVAYVSSLEQRDVVITQLKEVVSVSRLHVIVLKNEKTDLEQTATKLAKDIPGIRVAVEDAKQQLVLAYTELEQDFRKKSNGKCGLLQTLMTVGTLVAGVAATGGAGMAVAGSVSGFVKLWNDNNESLGTLWQSRDILSAGLKKITPDANDVASGISAIQGAYEKLTAQEQTLPAFTLEREQFDRIASEYSGLSSAQEYKRLGYAFLDRVESLNKAILGYNASLVRVIDADHRIRAVEAAVSSADGAVSAQIDPTGPLMYVRMRNIRRATFEAAACLIHAQQKAMGYLMLRPQSPRISIKNAVEISGAHSNVCMMWVRSSESYRPIRRLISGAYKIPLRQFTTGADWDRFKAAGDGSRILKLNIHPRTISPKSHLMTLSGLRLTGARLLLNGVSPGDASVYWMMIQDGNELLIDGRKNLVSFTRPTFFVDGIIAEGEVVDTDSSQGGLYTGASLLATWMLIIKDSEVAVDYSKLEDVTIAMDGYYIPESLL